MGAEAPRRVVALRQEPTGQAQEMRGTVASVAKKDMKAGEMLDGEGGYTVWGKALPFATARETLPIGLAHGISLRRDIKAGTILRLEDVNLLSDKATSMYREAIGGQS